MKYILGTKEKMTQVFDEQGRAIPATLISAGPTTVTQIKTEKKDGYNAVQVGYGEKKSVKKPQKKLCNYRYIKEFSAEGGPAADWRLGDTIDVSIFSEGDKIAVTGISKGKGFQGVVKRHGFHGGPRTHGQKHSEREPGSIGATGPQRVFKGVRMAGRMGSDRVNVKNLKVLKIDKENNQMIISGALPGHKGTLLEIYGK